MSYVIVLGGGIDQLPSIRLAKKMKLKTIVFDSDKNAISKKDSEFFINISNRKSSAIVKAINKLKINKKNILGIIVAGSDIPHIANEISKKLGIYYPINSKAAKISVNKLLMKKFLFANKITTPKYFCLKNFSHLKKILKKNMVIKPINGSGSRGVFKISKSMKDITLKKIYNSSLAFSKNKKLIAETFIEGKQISTESIIYKKQIYTYGLALRNYDYTKKYLPQILENGGTQPYPELFSRIKEINQIISEIAEKNDISNGVIKGDLVVDKNTNKLYVLEYALRLSGGDFSSFLIPNSTGYNFLKNSINIFINRKIQTNHQYLKSKKIFANRYIFIEKSKIKRINHSLKNKSWLIKFQQLLNPEKYIDRIKTHSDRAGVFVVTAKSINILEKRINQVYKSLRIID